MNSLLIATFTKESSARAAMRKLDGLASDGVIDLYQRTLVRKTIDGRMEVFRGDISAEWQTLAGATLGSLIGLFGGPVGFIVGLLGGAAVGSAVGDLGQYAFGKAFLKRMEMNVPAGTVSIVAHIGERGAQFVDSTLTPMGAEISRTRIYSEDVATEEINTLDADVGTSMQARLAKFENAIDRKFKSMDR